jgi:hypothetical protein
MALDFQQSRNQSRVSYPSRNLTPTPLPFRPHPAGNWWREKQADAARRRAEDEKRAEELAQEGGRVRNNPALWKKG